MSYFKIIETLSSKKIHLKNVKIKFLSNYNNDVIKDYTRYYLRNYNLNGIYLKDKFDQIDQELFSYKRGLTDVLIIGYDFNFKFDFNFIELTSYLDLIKKTLTYLEIEKKFEFTDIILFTLSNPESLKYFTIEKKNIIKKKINFFNNRLINLTKKKNNFKVLEFDEIVKNSGSKYIYDLKNYYSFKSPFSELGNEEIGTGISKIIGITKTINKKCLVLDLDNTLWRGVLGDLGAEHIDVGSTYQGEGYLRFQKYLKCLKKRGIILAIASKNNLSDVKEVFEINKNLILKREDFSIVKANWEPKYKNLNAIAKELNIGKEDIVFFDDSKFERAEMKNFNKVINIIDVPNDPYKFISAIEESNFFTIRRDTKEDRRKAIQYKILDKSKKYEKTFKNLNDFYKNLSIKLYISEGSKNFDRAVQLINKTNQFNLTNNRFSEKKLKQFFSTKNNFSFLGRVVDKFGDHGVTCLCMAKKEKNQIIIENFILSCRILGRSIEKKFLNEVLIKLKDKKIKTVVGKYNKSEKNIHCKDFYVNNNFIRKNNKFYFDLKKLKKVKGYVKTIHE